MRPPKKRNGKSLTFTRLLYVKLTVNHGERVSSRSDLNAKEEENNPRCLLGRPIADISMKHRGLEENVGQQVSDPVLAAFNLFETGFAARHENCIITSPPFAGRLHKTLILSGADASSKYVVQKLRLKPFDLEAVEHMFQLLEIAQGHAESKGAFEKGGVLEDWTKVGYFDVRDGHKREVCGRQVGQKILYECDEHGSPLAAWRVMEFVEGKIFDNLADIGKDEKNPYRRRQCQLKAATLLGEAIARFAILMNFLPEDAQFMDTLPGFHDTQGYVDEINDLLAGRKTALRPGKGTSVARMVDGLLDGGYREGMYAARVRRMIEIFRRTCSLADAFKGLPPSLQRAMAHGDLKINNVIWDMDERGWPDHVKCFIDLDTIGVYTALDDFGDASRSIINVLGESIWENSRTPADITLDREVFEKLTEGYLKGIERLAEVLPRDGHHAAAGKIYEKEIRVYLHRAVAVYFFQLGTRFFKAFISEPAEPSDADNQRHFVYFARMPEDDLEDKNLRLAEVQYSALLKFLREYEAELGLDELGIDLTGIPEPLGW